MFSLADYVKGDHTYHQSRGVKNGTPVIYIDCDQCGFATAWMPDETTRDVARRWNRAHGQS